MQFSVGSEPIFILPYICQGKLLIAPLSLLKEHRS